MWQMHSPNTVTKSRLLKFITTISNYLRKQQHIFNLTWMYNPNDPKKISIPFSTSALPLKKNNQSSFPNFTITHPPPPTTVPSWGNKFRARNSKNEPKIDLIPSSRSTKQGLQAVMYDRNEYMVNMVDSCKYTLIGKFYGPIPKMEAIRKKFVTQVELSGSVRITHFNTRHIYIDLENELDRANALDSKRLYIEGKFMRIHVWTPIFSQNLKALIVPVWVLLPKLPWHYYYKEFVTHLLADVG
ncbi:hypothetical protein H5410_046261 [Solanum commersonii]|uniref:DUF4283 domain-containing protein n=1 Tax=Solanum commersonii TaxID=4109 RepID=A0A9J5XBS3_SOLCO|nr:hypothetical protein H5410_046261 [Solanum commersonii]